jgi:tetratricopeptide (TPR) repeat protein
MTEEVEEAFTAALELFERGADVREQFPVLRGLASLYMFRGQLDRAAEIGGQILVLGERTGDARMLVDGHLLVGAHMMFVVDLQRGLDHLDQAIALFSGVPIRAGTARVGNDSRVACYTSSGFALWLLGYPDEAVARMDAALALARELEHPFTSAYAHFHAGLLRLLRRDAQAANDFADTLLDIAEEHGFRVWTATGTCLRGAARARLGRTDVGLADIRHGVDLYRELRSPPVFWPDLLMLDAGASHAAGFSVDALRVIDTALEFVGPDNVMQPEYLMLKGDLLAAGPSAFDAGRSASEGPRDRRSDAEALFRQACAQASATGARMSHLRAATRLARMLLDDGRPDAAAERLGPVHATFTEGFETADVREAGELLAAIAAAPRAGTLRP